MVDVATYPTLSVVALLQLVSEALMLNWTVNEPSTVPPADSGQALKVIVRPAPEMPQVVVPPPGRVS